MRIFNSPILAFIAFIAFIGLAYYSQNQHNFIEDQLSQYDSTKTRNYVNRPNIKQDIGIRYQADLADMYGAQPVVLIRGEK